MLLTALGRVANTGMVRSFSGNSIADTGTAPVMIEPVTARVTLRSLAGDLAGIKVFPLDADGRRKKPLLLKAGKNSVEFDLAPGLQSIHFEVVR
jgi:hypothetical protein